MRVSGRTLMTLAVVAIVGAMVFTAWGWPFRAALFPLAVGVPVLLLTLIELICVISGRTETLEEESLGADFRLSETADPQLAGRRTVAISLWIIAFLLLILLVGFPIAIALFFVMYLRFGAAESWSATLTTASAAWASFYILFVWLLNTPLHEGWIQQWFGQ
ncbi:MAG: tripartite tricarboxylate transporter TctB family protein [Candidatus Binatia bacterium]